MKINIDKLIEDLKHVRVKHTNAIAVVSYPTFTAIRKQLGISQDVTGITLHGVKLVITPDNNFQGFSVFPIDEDKAFEIELTVYNQPILEGFNND